MDDFAWDAFGESEDHMVPYSSSDHLSVHKTQDKCKRPRYELSSSFNCDENKSTSTVISKSNEGRSTTVLKEISGIMPEKGSGACSSNGVLPTSYDVGSNKQAIATASEADETPNYCLESGHANSTSEALCDDDRVLGDQVGNNSFHYQLNQMSEPVNHLNFFSNVQQEKESGDLLFYGWPEIENFEDVDKMFRSCDSTFGLGTTSEDGLSWFSSPHAIEESDDAFNQGFKFSAPGLNVLKDAPDYDGISRLNNADCFIDESDDKSMPFCQSSSSKILDADDTAVIISSLENGSEATTQLGVRTQYMPHKGQEELRETMAGKRRDHHLERGESYIHLDKLNQRGDQEQKLGTLSHQYSSANIRHEQTRMLQNGADTQLPLICPIYNHQSSQPLTSSGASTVKSEDNGPQFLSQNESSYGSNQMQTVENCDDAPRQIPAMTGGKRNTQSNKRVGLSVHRKHAGLGVQSASSDLLIAQKQVDNFESEVEGNSGVDGNNSSIPSVLDSSNAQGSACLSSMVDEVLQEASSFVQLQHVMEKLDVKTKLCIRDSLYRLAKSAEQRHKCAELTGGSQGDKDVTGVMASAESNKCAGFIDMETDTNPIDRSVAHLLFHRPSDPSAVPATDTISLEMVHTTDCGRPGATEQPVSQEGSNEAGLLVAAATTTEEKSNLC